MSNESRRRLTVVAGAVAAGAVIPIAAAASAWANDETENFSQLVSQGLNYYEAYEVVQAENTGLPVEVSYDGNLVVDTNQIANPLTGAVAESGPDNDIAAAIATNSPAILNQTIATAIGGSNDVAFADGGGAFVQAGDIAPLSLLPLADSASYNNDTATAIGTYSFAMAGDGNSDSATDIGSNSFANATANNDTVYDLGSGVGNGANDISAGGGDDYVIGIGNGLPNTDVVNTGVFDIVTPWSGGPSLSATAAAVTNPSALLSDATTNYTDANQLLGEIPSGQFASVSSTISQQDIDIQDIASLGTSENALSTYDNGVLADLLSPVFSSVNQGWDQASEAALTADQALETAVSGGSAPDISTALLGLIGPAWQALGPDLDSNLIDLGAHLLTGVDPSAAGLDAGSVIDPNIFTDLLTSIGL